MTVTDGQLCVAVTGGTENPWDVSIGYDLSLVDGAAYTLSFSASADPAAAVLANVQLNEEPYTQALGQSLTLTSTLEDFSYDFAGNVDTDTGVLTFQLGGNEDDYTFCLDDVSLTTGELVGPGPDAPNQVTNGTFTGNTDPWFSYEASTPALVGGRLCVDTAGGLENVWEAGVGQNDVRLVAGEAYALSFDASADPATTIRASVQLGEDPYTGYFVREVELTETAEGFEFVFIAPESTSIGQVVFQIGGPDEFTFCVDNVELRGGR